MNVPVPLGVRSNIGQHFPTWVDRLPSIVRDIADRWELDVGAPFDPGGQASWVAPATDRAGRELVLKVAPTLPENRDEALGLELLAPVGAASPYRTEWTGPAVTKNDGPDAGTVALLTERIRPGNTLSALATESDHDAVIADVLRSMWTINVEDAPLRPLAELTPLWARNFETDLVSIAGLMDPGIAREGVALFRTLAHLSDDRVLLHTDLHAGNVLAGESGWRLIDPKPYVGDRCYDVLQHLLNCRRFERDPLGLITRVADLTSLDRDQLHAWMFARCVIEAVWDPRRIAVAHQLGSAM